MFFKNQWPFLKNNGEKDRWLLGVWSDILNGYMCLLCIPEIFRKFCGLARILRSLFFGRACASLANVTTQSDACYINRWGQAFMKCADKVVNVLYYTWAIFLLRPCIFLYTPAKDGEGQAMSAFHWAFHIDTLVWYNRQRFWALHSHGGDLKCVKT